MTRVNIAPGNTTNLVQQKLGELGPGKFVSVRYGGFDPEKAGHESVSTISLIDKLGNVLIRVHQRGSWGLLVVDSALAGEGYRQDVQIPLKWKDLFTVRERNGHTVAIYDRGEEYEVFIDNKSICHYRKKKFGDVHLKGPAAAIYADWTENYYRAAQMDVADIPA